MKRSNPERKLDRVLKELNLSHPISVDDIKNFIWNETNHLDLARLFQFLTEDIKSEKKAEEVMNLLQDAWNAFPHKSLQGLSPEEKIKGKAPPKKIIVPKTTTKVHNLFPERYPERVRFIKIDEVEWGFEFPGYYYDLFERLFQMDEEDLTAKEYENELKTILRICPETFDATRELAEFCIYNREPELAREILEKTINLARSYIPNNFVPGKHKIIWAFMDNRPFLRLLATYAQFVEDLEGVNNAIPYYQELVSLNPNDNQGIRELLSTAYLETNRLEDLMILCSSYPGDILPAITFGKIIGLLIQGKDEEAKKQLKKVTKYQKHIIKELLKPSHPKLADLEEGLITVGGEDEAYYYWLAQGKFWKETKGALGFLRKYSDINIQ